MAIWQCDFDIVPRGVEAEENCFVGWTDETRGQLAAALHRLLPEAKSCLEDVIMLGSEDGNRIDILYANDRKTIDSVLVRISLREDPRPFVTQLCQACVRFGVVLRSNGVVRTSLEPSAEIVLAHLLRSKAAEFMRDPHGLLDKLDRAASGEN